MVCWDDTQDHDQHLEATNEGKDLIAWFPKIKECAIDEANIKRKKVIDMNFSGKKASRCHAVSLTWRPIPHLSPNPGSSVYRRACTGCTTVPIRNTFILLKEKASHMWMIYNDMMICVMFLVQCFWNDILMDPYHRHVFAVIFPTLPRQENKIFQAIDRRPSHRSTLPISILPISIRLRWVKGP